MKKTNVEVDAARQMYVKNGVNHSFDYVWRKHCALVEWCGRMKHGVNTPIRDTMYGTEYGWHQYKEAEYDVKAYCQIFKTTCDAMLHPDIRWSEGLYIWLRWINSNKSTQGIVTESGLHIRYHEIIKPGNKVGSRITPWNVQVWGVV